MPALLPTHGTTSAARAQAIIGVGPITADAVVASIGAAHEFKNGRQLAAWLGLVPTGHSSGGHTRLGTISGRGDTYLRTLLIQGARSRKENTMTSESLKAQGKSTKCALLTESLLWNC